MKSDHDYVLTLTTAVSGVLKKSVAIVSDAQKRIVKRALKKLNKLEKAKAKAEAMPTGRIPDNMDEFRQSIVDHVRGGPSEFAKWLDDESLKIIQLVCNTCGKEHRSGHKCKEVPRYRPLRKDRAEFTTCNDCGECFTSAAYLEHNCINVDDREAAKRTMESIADIEPRPEPTIRYVDGADLTALVEEHERGFVPDDKYRLPQSVICSCKLHWCTYDDASHERMKTHYKIFRHGAIVDFNVDKAVEKYKYIAACNACVHVPAKGPIVRQIIEH